MLRSGADYLQSLRDGRRVYVGGRLIEDVTEHPAFRNSARSFARLYDLKRDPAFTDQLSFEEDGERHSFYFKRARTVEDLAFRMRGHKCWADASYGLFGRSPDHVASFVTGMAQKPEVFDLDGHGFPQRLLEYWRYIRDRDLYVVYAVHPPQGARNYTADSKAHFFQSPSLHVSAVDADGVTLDGMKMLATGGVYCDEIWVGNLSPLAPGREREAVTCAVPVNAPGVSLWSRKPYEAAADSEFDNPLSSRFDESDVMLVCEKVRVPWSRVFTMNHVDLARRIYIDTAGHCFGNHQSNVRFLAKLQLLVGLASRIAQSASVRGIPAVQETLGRLAAQEALLSGLLLGQVHAAEAIGDGYLMFNRRYMYAALNWCQESHPAICWSIRELMGGAVFQMPADAGVLENPKLAGIFEDYWSTPSETAAARMKLYKLAWDLLGSEFGQRHLQYENFYAGPTFLVRAHSMREAPWAMFDGVVDRLLASYPTPGERTAEARAA